MDDPGHQSGLLDGRGATLTVQPLPGDRTCVPVKRLMVTRRATSLDAVRPLSEERP